MQNYLYSLFLCLLLHGVTFAQAQTNVATIDSVATDTLHGDTLAVDTFAVAIDVPFGEVLKQRLVKLLENPTFERTQVGLYVYDLTGDSLVFAHNQRQQLRPASTQKVITAVTALSQLGTDYRYTTQLFLSGTIVDSTQTLQGDIAIRGGFDPLFRRDDLHSFITSLRERGITRIAGNVLIDLSMKDETRLGWGWCWDDPYGGLTPLLYNGKDQFEEKWRTELADAGIAFSGYFLPRTVPATAELINERHHTIAQVLQTMMKESDNLFAESMFYQLVAQSRRPWATYKEGASRVYTLLRSLGIDTKTCQVADGSGLSLYNYTTPEILATLLRYAYQHQDIYETLLPSLPIAGVDGTLRRRMRSGAAHGNVRAKTGTVEGVSALAGYLTAGNGNRYAFAIMNQGILSTATGRNFQDRVCQALTAK